MLALGAGFEDSHTGIEETLMSKETSLSPPAETLAETTVARIRVALDGMDICDGTVMSGKMSEKGERIRGRPGSAGQSSERFRGV